MLSGSVDARRFFARVAPKSSGKRFEEQVGERLSSQGLSCLGREVEVASNPYGGKHVVDWLFQAPGEDFWQLAVSCKYQLAKGTTEQKLEHELFRLWFLLEDNPRIARAHLILDGSGFSPGLRTYLTGRLLKAAPVLANIDIHFGLDSIPESGLEVDPLPGRHLPAPTLF